MSLSLQTEQDGFTFRELHSKSIPVNFRTEVARRSEHLNWGCSSIRLSHYLSVGGFAYCKAKIRTAEAGINRNSEVDV